jgi:DNA-binding MarR family transcriptional regulator
MAKKEEHREEKSTGKAKRKAQLRTVSGFSRFLFAMNLMLEAAAFESEYKLTREETLLLSIFRNGNDYPHSLEVVASEFRKLLSVHPQDRYATADLDKAVEGLVAKGLLKSLHRGADVQITARGQVELKRVSAVMDSVWDRLTDGLDEHQRTVLKELIGRINPNA